MSKLNKDVHLRKYRQHKLVNFCFFVPVGGKWWEVKVIERERGSGMTAHKCQGHGGQMTSDRRVYLQ